MAQIGSESLNLLQDTRIQINTGYEVQRLVYGIKLILGGNENTKQKEQKGNSDADVL